MEPEYLNFGIDWDDTVTADPLLFVEIIQSMQARGHKVYITTARSERDAESCTLFLEARGIKDVVVCPTTYRSKKRTMDALGINIDIWIDDHPTRVHIDEVHEPHLPPEWHH